MLFFLTEPVFAEGMASPSQTKVIESTIVNGPDSRPKLVLREKRVTRRPSVKISSETFKRLSPKKGHWKGLVQGNGTIHLFLIITRNGRMVLWRKIGQVTMGIGEKQISFNYTGLLPKGSGWKWKIIGRVV